MQAFTLVS